jgi:Zn-dependent protease with chaperone function
MYEFLGISLALAAWLVINAFASLGATIVWRIIESRVQDWSAASRSQLIFVLRFLPLVLATIMVAAFLIPAYIFYEPRHGSERVSLQLAVVAGLSGYGLVLAVWRRLAAWMATRRLINDWIKNAVPIKSDRIPIPAFHLQHSFPVIAVVGVFRRRLFIANHLFDSLHEEELAAAIAHECGHLKAIDNLKRVLMRVSRDVLTIIPSGRALDRVWAQESEAAADEYAARSGGEAALNLASALVKIARMAPAGAQPSMPVTVSHISHDISLIAQRVERLTHLAMLNDLKREPHEFAGNSLLWLCLGALLITIAPVVLNPNLYSTIHGWIEIIVSLLQ